MKFRKEQVDEVLIIEARLEQDFTKELIDLGKKYIIIDLQYAINNGVYSALVLAKVKK